MVEVNDKKVFVLVIRLPTLIGCTKSMSVKKEMTRAVTHLVALESPNIIPYMSRKKQETAMQPKTRIHPRNTVHHGRVNFFFFLQEGSNVRVKGRGNMRMHYLEVMLVIMREKR